MSARFVLDEAKAAEWLAAAVGRNAFPGQELAEITEGWAPAAEDGWGVESLIDAAIIDGIITAPAGATVAFNFTRDGDGPSYYWTVHLTTTPGRGPVLVSPWEDIRYLGEGEEAAGASAALGVLREAAGAANGMLDDLDAYVAASVQP